MRGGGNEHLHVGLLHVAHINRATAGVDRQAGPPLEVPFAEALNRHAFRGERCDARFVVDEDFVPIEDVDGDARAVLDIERGEQRFAHFGFFSVFERDRLWCLQLRNLTQRVRAVLSTFGFGRFVAGVEVVF